MSTKSRWLETKPMTWATDPKCWKASPWRGRKIRETGNPADVISAESGMLETLPTSSAANPERWNPCRRHRRLIREAGKLADIISGTIPAREPPENGEPVDFRRKKERANYFIPHQKNAV